VKVVLKKGQDIFAHGKKRYVVSEREKGILERQEKTLSDELFLKLIKDFQLLVVHSKAVVVPFGAKDEKKDEKKDENKEKKGSDNK